jgi:hypothetical protein
MSDLTSSHASFGRTPWRRQLQLRLFPALADDDSEPVTSLTVAARSVEAVAYWESWQKEEAYRRLRVLCEWFDEQLDHPARVTRVDAHIRQVTVFDCLVYTVDAERRRITSGGLIKGRHEPSEGIVEVGHPLITHRWLAPILRNLGLADFSQADIFFDTSEIGEVERWLAETAYRLLLRNPEFRQFRRTLPGLFGIPRDIYSIALASRSRPVGPLIDSRMINTVWRNEPAFRQVARENPQLLPLLFAFVEHKLTGESVDAPDPVQALKKHFLGTGLSEASWRYLVRHGARLFRVPWEVSGKQPPLEVATRYLEVLQSAGLPPPPPPSVARVLLHGYNPHQRTHACIGEQFHLTIDPVALRAGLLEADRRRRAGKVEGFAEEFLGVCWWSEALLEFLDDNQIKAGWPWFVRRWKEEEKIQATLDTTEIVRWGSRLREFPFDGTVVVPVTTSEEMVRESLAMRNCLQTYIDKCASGDFEVYSVRDRRTGKHLGCIGVQFDELDIPMVVDVKGFANTPPTGVVQQAAGEVFQRLQRVDCDREILQVRHLLSQGDLPVYEIHAEDREMIEAAMDFGRRLYARTDIDGAQRSAIEQMLSVLENLPQIAAPALHSDFGIALEPTVRGSGDDGVWRVSVRYTVLDIVGYWNEECPAFRWTLRPGAPNMNDRTNAADWCRQVGGLHSLAIPGYTGKIFASARKIDLDEFA